MASGLLTDRAVERLWLELSTLSGDVTRHIGAGVEAHAGTGILQSPFLEAQIPSQVVSATTAVATVKLPSGSLSVVMPIVPL